MERLKEEVDSTPDEKVIGMNPDDWVQYLVNKYGMQPIVLDELRNHRLVEVEQVVSPIWWKSAEGVIIRRSCNQKRLRPLAGGCRRMTPCRTIAGLG
jgi:hypothetical protein